jgi:hypothetical protein
MNRSKKPFSVAAKVENLAVRWTDSEVMEQREPSSLLEWPSRDRTRRSQKKMPIMNGKQSAIMTTSVRRAVHRSQLMGGVRVECKKTRQENKGDCTDFRLKTGAI